MSDMLTVLQGDWVEQLKTLPDESVHCCVTSPPYWGLRDYGVRGQLGLEKTPEEYVARVVDGFREVRRVIRTDGTLWMNLGDSYARNGGEPGGGNRELMHLEGKQRRMLSLPDNSWGLKPKDLVGIPWRVAFALQADGWYLRSDIIWHKPNPMPESVTDRPTKSHEYIFLLSKSQKYFYDAQAIAEPGITGDMRRPYGSEGSWELDGRPTGQRHGGQPRNGKIDKEGRNSRIHVSRDPQHEREYNGKHRNELEQAAGRRLLKNVAEARANGGDHENPFGTTRNKRTVWTVATAPYSEAHFATFPPDLIKPCILAGCPVGGTVLDPFGGSFTTGQVALELGRKAIMIELNPAYCEMGLRRTNVTYGLPLS